MPHPGLAAARAFLAGALLAGSLLLTGRAEAHPHVWIDLRTEVLLDEQQRITGLKVDWLFDQFYSAFAFEDLNRNGDELVTADEFQAFAADTLANLESYGYFTSLRAGGKELALDSVTDYLAEMEGVRLRLAFTLPLAEPLDALAQPFTYAIYDPTFFIEILHAKEDPVGFGVTGDAPGDLANACRFTLLPPNPDASTMAFASSLDRTQSGGDDLGRSFAEQVTVRCGQPAD